MTEILRCVIYARVSTSMQVEEETPIEAQIAECEACAKSKGWQVVRVFTDAGYSGGTVDRPAFQDMYAWAKDNKPRPYDIVLTWRNNRLFRDVEARLAYSRMFRRMGIRLVSMHEPEFGEDAAARVAEIMFGAFDEYYRGQISGDTLRGLKLVARRGFSTGGLPPTGYRNVRKATGKIKANGEPEMRTTWEPDVDTFPKVRQAFEMYAQGKTLVEIVEATKIVSAKNGLSTLLRNRAYLGERIYNTTRRASLQEKKTHRIKNKPSDVVAITGAHEPIVSDELFNRVQTILESRRPKIGQRKQSPHDYILSGLLWCKEHDVPYAGHTTGEKCYYACGLRKKLGKKRVSCAWLQKEPAEAFVLDTLKNRIFTRDLVRQGLEQLQKENAKARQEDDTELRETTAKAADLELQISRLVASLTDSGFLPSAKAAIQKGINERTKELDMLELRIAELEKQRDRALRIPRVTGADVDDVMARLRTMLETTELQELKTVLSHFIERIEIEGNRATFCYTFAEPKKSAIVSTVGDPEGI